MQKYKLYIGILILLLISMPSYTVFAELPSDQETIQQHLELVESGLRERDVSHLSPTLRKARIQNLNALRAYWKKGVFPRNTHHTARTPYFIDNEGRTCAMAQLLIDSGYEEEAVRISQRENYSYIHDMKSPELAQWIETSGLTLQEAAWIQPNYEPVRPEGFIGCQCDCDFAVVNDGQSAYVNECIASLCNDVPASSLEVGCGAASSSRTIISYGVELYGSDACTSQDFSKYRSEGNIGFDQELMCQDSATEITGEYEREEPDENGGCSSIGTQTPEKTSHVLILFFAILLGMRKRH